MSERTTDNLPEEGTVATRQTRVISAHEMKDRISQFEKERGFWTMILVGAAAILLLIDMQFNSPDTTGAILAFVPVAGCLITCGIVAILYAYKLEMLEQQPHEVEGVVSDVNAPEDKLLVTLKDGESTTVTELRYDDLRHRRWLDKRTTRQTIRRKRMGWGKSAKYVEVERW